MLNRSNKFAEHDFRPGRKSGRLYDVEREDMINLLTQRGIQDKELLRAMSLVDRHEFVQAPFGNRAYEDSALPIGHSQTISQPYTVAFMTQCLEIRQGDKVLEIGTGSGYQAAILSEMGARVFTIERHMDLLTQARKRFEKLNYEIASKCGDGTIGWKEFSPFDKIMVTAGAPEIPEPLLGQLKEGGLLVIPIGDLEVQNLHVVKRSGIHFETKEIVGFKFVPLIGKRGWK